MQMSKTEKSWNILAIADHERECVRLELQDNNNVFLPLEIYDIAVVEEMIQKLQVAKDQFLEMKRKAV